MREEGHHTAEEPGSEAHMVQFGHFEMRREGEIYSAVIEGPAGRRVGDILLRPQLLELD